MNIVVIGAGPAGEAAAKYSAKQKANVTLIEKDFMGGVCLNWGCIPSKTLLSFGKKIHDLKRFYCLKPGLEMSDATLRRRAWAEMKAEKDRVVKTLRDDVEKTVKLHGIKILRGEAKFISEKEVEIKIPSGREKVSFDKAILAVGSIPVFPPPLDARKKEILDSDGVFDIEDVPESLLIVGGGAVGCEFACLFHELGCKVAVVEKTGNLIPGEDAQIVNALRKSFEARGIQVLDSTTVQDLKKAKNQWQVKLSNGLEIQVREILACVGRRARTGALDLEKANVRTSKKGIEVDGQLRTTNPDIFAAGDATGLSLLAHAGTVQGEIAAANALGENKTYDGSFVPRCLYTWPEVASVGMWIAQAQEQHIETKSQRFFFSASGRALAEGDSEGFIQIVSDKDMEQILGAQIIGPHATELIHVISVALKNQMTRSELKEVIFAHPTFSEGFKAALNR